MRKVILERRAQSAVEFMILIGAALFFFLGFLFSVNLNSADKRAEQRNLIVKEIALTVQNEINLASESVDGYYRKFELPSNIAGLDYDINIIEDFVYVNTTNGKYALAFPIVNVSGNLQKGENSIRKSNGEVFLNS